MFDPNGNTQSSKPLDANPDGWKEVCSSCHGRGQTKGIVLPIVVSAIAIGVTWLAWREIPNLLSMQNARQIRAILFFSLLGPIAFVYAWWKLYVIECDDCEGTGVRLPGKETKAIIKVTPKDPTILDDRPCHRCRYNLRTLSVGARCPECGETILPAADALRIVESKRRLRIGLIVAFLFLLGLAVCNWLWGGIGILWFMGCWALLTFFFWVGEKLRALRAYPGGGRKSTEEGQR